MAKRSKYTVVLIHSCAGDYVELSTSDKELDHIKEVFDNRIEILGEFENMFEALYLLKQKMEEYQCSTLTKQDKEV